MAIMINGQDCHGSIVTTNTRRLARLTTCSGWVLNKLHNVKQWMVEDVRKYDFKELEVVKKSGSEPIIEIFEISAKYCEEYGEIIRQYEHTFDLAHKNIKAMTKH